MENNREITLTDIDGIEFKVNVDMIRELKDHKSFRTVCFLYAAMTDDVKVRESIPEIIPKIKEAKDDNTV